jgi:adenylate kinase
MMVSITGTPCVGKTTISKEFEKEGWNYLDLKRMIFESGTGDGMKGEMGEVLVDEQGLRDYLEEFKFPVPGNSVLDGHLSYLAPSDICIVLRLDPRVLKDRLKEREYAPRKVRENVEAEAVSVILIEAMDMEKERLGGVHWRKLPSRCGIVFEVDASGKSISEVFQQTIDIIDAYRGKRLNELSEYRPGRVDWLEEMLEWF